MLSEDRKIFWLQISDTQLLNDTMAFLEEAFNVNVRVDIRDIIAEKKYKRNGLLKQFLYSHATAISASSSGRCNDNDDQMDRMLMNSGSSR